MGYKRQHKDPLAYICPESSISLKQQDKILRERAGSGDWCGCGCCIRKRQRNEGQEFHSPLFLIFYLQLLPKESSNNLMGFFFKNSAQLKFVGNTNTLPYSDLFIYLFSYYFITTTPTSNVSFMLSWYLSYFGLIIHRSKVHFSKIQYCYCLTTYDTQYSRAPQKHIWIV